MKGKLGKEALTKFAVPSAKDIPPQWQLRQLCLINNFEKKKKNAEVMA